MKILHTISPMIRKDGGIVSALQGLTKAIECEEVTNLVRMPLRSECVAELDCWKPVEAQSVGKVIVPFLRWSNEYVESILENDAEILHTHGIWHHPSFMALDWKRRTGRPHVASVHGMLEPWAWRYRAWKKRPVWWLWERRNLQSASLLHATSEGEAESIRQRGLRAPIAIIPNGVGRPLVPSKRQTSAQRTVLFLSRIQVIKGLPMWVEVWNRVKPNGWKMRVVGPDEDGHRTKVREMVEKADLSDCWSFEDSLEDEAKWEAMAGADLFVLPSYSENFGIVVAEALACRTPVLTTKGTPWQGLVSHNCGWWVDPSVDGLEKGFREALSRVDMFSEMGERGRSWVERDFGWEGIAEKMIASYEWVLGRGARPNCVI